MNHGKLKWQITLFHEVRTQAPTGQVTTTYAQYAQPWAQRIEQRISEAFSAGADQVRADVVWRIRWRSDIAQTDVVEYGGERFEITGIQEEVFRQWQRLICKRIGSNV